MKVIKFVTTNEEQNRNELLDSNDSLSVKDVIGDKEQIESFFDYKIRESYPKKTLTLLYDLLKSTLLSEIPEEYLIDVLKGKSYIRKKVTTEYLIIENDGEDITKKIDDDFINYLSSDKSDFFPKDKQYMHFGNDIISVADYENGKIKEIVKGEKV